jgi:acetoacetate decarboxylase
MFSTKVLLARSGKCVEERNKIRDFIVITLSIVKGKGVYCEKGAILYGDHTRRHKDWTHLLFFVPKPRINQAKETIEAFPLRAR